MAKVRCFLAQDDANAPLSSHGPTAGWATNPMNPMKHPVCLAIENVGNHTAPVHFNKIVSKTQPSAAHATPRMSQIMRIVN
jgi:hypothetical protein